MEIGNKIFELRKKNNLSQEQLAEKMDVTRQTISKWELGETSPDLKQAKELAKIFNVSLDELVNNNINNIVIAKLNDTEKVVRKTTKTIKVLAITIYLLILFSSIFIAIHFITKKDFTTKYQTEFTCIFDDEEHYINVDLEDGKYYLTYNDSGNGGIIKHPAGNTLVDVYETLKTFKKFVIDMGGSCK